MLLYELAFATGAMVSVVSNEAIPRIRAEGFERAATMNPMIRFVMMILDDQSAGVRARRAMRVKLEAEPTPSN